MRAGIGISDHTGWAVLVAVRGDIHGPEVVLRRRLTLVDPRLPRQVYHAVAEQGQPIALVDEVISSAQRECGRELAATISSLAEDGMTAVQVAVAGNPAPLPPVERVLASHTLLHASEGHLYREALSAAAEAAGLSWPREARRRRECRR